jgi:predicted O-methyltransferase YrrM
MGKKVAYELFKNMTSPRFHEQLYHLVLDEKPSVMVETGYATGLSAMHILAAMDINRTGKLYSLECFTNQDIIHPRFNYLRGMSQVLLPSLALNVPVWDIFLHDSDHEAPCQKFEFEFAWKMLRPGGILISDDYEWGDPPHYTWKKFLESHEHSDLTTIGCAQWCRKI